MAYWDLQGALNINLDKWLINLSSEQPLKRASRCYSFEKDWIECSHGIGQTRANVECRIEYEDFCECLHKAKTAQRLAAIIKQRDKLIKEGKYTSPPHHSGKVETRP